MPIRQVKVHPSSGELWLLADAQEDVYLPVQLPYPEMLQQHTLLCIAVDPERMPAEDEPQCRLGMQRAVDTLGVGVEWPLLVLCPDADKARRLLPDGLSALIIDEPMLRELVFAPQPPQTLAGLLLTRGLLALSPYSPSGEVRDERMFYGRERVLREVLQAAAPQCLLVGPRRIGKSSLLRRLQAEIPRQHASVQVMALDMLGIGEPARLAQLLARRFQRSTIPAGDAQAQAVAIDDMLRTHFSDPQRPGLLLIDESDALVEADAAAGFPLLNRWRSLQADGVCSFILAGYWYLYLRTLDHSSPVYNFAAVRELGPLDAESGRILASEPMARLGITYADPSVPTRLVQRTGGYPSLIQFLCDQLLKQLERDRTLVITPEHLTRVEHSPATVPAPRRVLSHEYGARDTVGRLSAPGVGGVYPGSRPHLPRTRYRPGRTAPGDPAAPVAINPLRPGDTHWWRLPLDDSACPRHPADRPGAHLPCAALAP